MYNSHACLLSVSELKQIKKKFQSLEEKCTDNLQIMYNINNLKAKKSYINNRTK